MRLVHVHGKQIQKDSSRSHPYKGHFHIPQKGGNNHQLERDPNFVQGKIETLYSREKKRAAKPKVIHKGIEMRLSMPPVALFFLASTFRFHNTLGFQSSRPIPVHFLPQHPRQAVLTSYMSSNRATTSIPSWTDVQDSIGKTPVGDALNKEVKRRKDGHGSAHVQNTLRLFEYSDGTPPITLYRDHAGWCPYCQKTMLLIEEKRVPVQISLVNMRSYGDKPAEFLRKVPNGLLPAIEVNGQVITESSVIMGLLDQWHPPEKGYLPMMPSKDDEQGNRRYDRLARLERDLFSWWCSLIFRPEMPRLNGGNNVLGKLLGGDGDMSGTMKGFMDCLRQVDQELQATRGPWFFENDHPTMIDFVYVSHVERMLASCAFWKGLNLRDPKWNLVGINAWLDAFEKREPYLAFKSDYYTHVKDIPPQYGPGYDGGFQEDRKKFSNSILGLVRVRME